MAVKTPPLLYAWTSVVLLWISWVVMLGGVGSLQAVGPCPMDGPGSLPSLRARWKPKKPAPTPPAELRRFWGLRAPARWVRGIPVSLWVWVWAGLAAW